MKRIITGIDLESNSAESSIATLKWSIEEARTHNAEVEVVYAIPPLVAPYAPTEPAGPSAIDAETHDEIAIEMQKQLNGLVATVTDDEQSGVHVQVVVATGDPEYLLVERSKNADLVVVGERHHGGVLSAVLGSVSDHVVHNAHCPVVVIPAA
jgi:nucleotide-binding universal stress UspA family protein